MKTIKKEGYMIDPKKVNKILNKKAVKDYLKSLAQLDEKASNLNLVDEAGDYILKLKPIEIALLDLERSNYPGIKHHGYVTARADEGLMFESSYLSVVLGTPPYNEAVNFGLDENDIKEYQQEWRDIGIEPTLIEWQEEEMPSILSDKNQSLLTVAENILKEENFYYSHCYWSLEQNVSYDKFTEFAPGIDMGINRDNGKFWLRAVVRCDVFAQQLIYIDNEELLRAVLCSMIMYIKDWHDNFQDKE
jgi:hypothetical protein